MEDIWTSVRGWWTSALQAAAIAAVATIVVFAASHATSYQDLRLWTFDFVATHAGLSAPSPDIVFVDFDEDTFQRLQKWPVPRSAVAEVVRRVGEQKPRVVGLDILLSEPRTEAEDKQMQDALTSAGVVVVASQDSVGILPPVTPLPIFCQPEDPTAASGFCKEGTPGALGYAFINLPQDADGFIRYAILVSNVANGKTPSLSFPLTLAQQYTGEAIKPVDSVHGNFNGHDVYYADHDIRNGFLIGSWGHSPLTHIPAWKFMSGEVAPNALTDKLVLIGQSNDAARDRHFTPMFRSADKKTGERLRMAGTEVLGAAIRSLIEGKAVRAITGAGQWTLVVFICFLTSFLLLRLQTGWGAVCALLLAACLVGVALFAYAKYRFWLSFLAAQMGIVVTLPLTLGMQFVLERVVSSEAREQRRELMSLFASYVDPAVANTIWKRRDEVSLAGEERIATVMFTDIRSFTSISSHRPPAEVLRWLNRYLTVMDEVIREHGGFLNKFIGDGLMIIFGLPLSRGVNNDAERAVRCGLAMLERVEIFNHQNKDNPALPQLRIGIGIHTGPLMAGSIGSASRQEYSVIGETVNLASRLESLNKPYKTEILLSHATYDLLGPEFHEFRGLGEAKVPGIEEPVPIFTVGAADPVEHLSKAL